MGKINKKLYRLTAISISVLLLLTVPASCGDTGGEIRTRAFFLDKNQMKERGHTERLKEYSSDNVAAYLNEDGTKTIYIYSGLINKTRNYIIEDGSGYLSAGSYNNKTFPGVLNSQSGVEIKEKSSNFMNIYPDGNSADETYDGIYTENINTFGQKLETVCYENVFGNGSDLYVYPTVYGVNSEIVIPDRDSAGSYKFKIKVPDAYPETTSPDYIILKNNNEEGDNLSIIYTPLITDSKGKWSFNNKAEIISKDSSDGTYIVEFTPDEEFLKDKNTKYPLVMNQSFYMAHGGEPDTSAYSETGDDARHYLSPYMLLGSHTFKGEGRTYIRYEILEELNIKPENIISAKYHFRNLYDLPEKSVIGLYAVTSDWCSVNTMWMSIPEYDEKIVTHTEIKKRGDYSMDITPLVRQFMKSKGNDTAAYSIRNGFFIKSESRGGEILLASGDSGLCSPYLELVFS